MAVVPIHDFDSGHFFGPLNLIHLQQALKYPDLSFEKRLRNATHTERNILNIKQFDMEPEKFCQSCTLPMENMEDRGNEKDGSKSNIYCKYCYQDGEFTEPDMTLDQMMYIAETEMKKQDLPEIIIQHSMNMLPRLKRWQSSRS